MLSKKVYRSYKEYYEVTLDEAIKTVKKCIKLTGSNLISEDKFYLDYKMSRSTALTCKHHKIIKNIIFETKNVFSLKYYIFYYFMMCTVRIA